MPRSLPQPVLDILTTLKKAGFEAFIVGGSLRDILLKRSPRDWDITTNALPEDIQRLFPESVYENTYGTVGIKVPRFLESTPLEHTTDIIEVTTHRIESTYSDARHPDKVQFTNSLEQDLSRRDFTINAIAGRINSGELEIIDPFDGEKDLKKKIIRAVGNPKERFEEDALRLLRAVRLLVELGQKEKSGALDWTIETATLTAMTTLASHVEKIAVERVQEEFSKILLSPNPSLGVEWLSRVGLLRSFLPELEEGIGVSQNLHHIYTVWEHNLKALETCPSKKLSVRLAALLHDVAKPRTKKGEGYRATFYNHDHVGGRMTKKILERLKYSREIIDHASLLVDQHLFYYNVGEVTEASVRRLIKRVGLENIDDLMAVRIGDRLGSGVPKAKPYKLRHLEYMIDKVSHDPISVKMLKISGVDIMQGLGEKPGPKIGALLDCLLAEVLDDPKKNDRIFLLDRAKKLMDNDLHVLRAMAKDVIEEKREKDDTNIKERHHVQ